MSNILTTIAEHNRMLVDEAILKVSRDEMRSLAHAAPQAPSFEDALRAPGLSFICEVKRASPSKGVIAQEFDPLAIACDYEAAGAQAISCLTEPKWFLGSTEYLRAIAERVRIPVLRKDFVVDSYQIYEARALGASAVLLLCGLLDNETLGDYLELCDALGICALVEAYDEDELQRAVNSGAHVIGTNNRNLRDFSVDFSRAARMRELIPEERVFVAESGVASLDDVRAVAESGAAALLVGEYLMRAGDRAERLAQMRAAAEGGAK